MAEGQVPCCGAGDYSRETGCWPAVWDGWREMDARKAPGHDRDEVVAYTALGEEGAVVF